MMPLAPTAIMTMPISKPKIAFSIDSIVGSRNLTKSPQSECSETPLSPGSDYEYPSDFNSHSKLPVELHRALRLPENCTQQELQQRINSISQNNNNYKTVLSPPQMGQHDIFQNIHIQPHQRNNSPPQQSHLSPGIEPVKRTPSPEQQSQRQQEPTHQTPTQGIPAGGLVRPYPLAPGHSTHNGIDIKQLPPYMHPSDLAQQQQHFFAAQFQAAAALAQHGFPPGAGMPAHPGHFNNPSMHRDSYPLYPWLLSRGRIFPHRFPGHFLLQPFRKPKRVRTAFSPTQLLKLEHAFENNHYVVGSERKTLAQALSLSETQVKVWFQNRRTKHKRMQQEEDAKGGGSGEKRSSSSTMNYEDEEDDELIDMDDCSSDEENEAV